MNGTTSSFSQEVLSLIFERLPVKDRKNVRLTCRLWYHVCSLPKIIKNEKFVFRKRADRRDCVWRLETGLRMCNIWRTYFEFHGFSLTQLSSAVWRSCGVRIQHLFLYNCDFDESTFAHIVFHCTRLIRFRLEINFDRHDVLFRYSNVTTPKIDALIRSGITREKLTSFEVYINDYVELCRVMYRKIFKIYPRIRVFGQRGSKPNSLTQRYTLSDDNFNESGEWAFPPRNLNTEHWFLPTLKLKEFRSLFCDVCSFRRDVIEFFRRQNELETVHVQIIFAFEDHDAILFHILESLPKLKELQYSARMCDDNIYLKAANFGRFLRGTYNLESLLLQSVEKAYLYPVIVDDWQPFSSPVKYTRLKKLLLGPLVNETIIFEILNRCSTSLQFLHLDPPTSSRIMEIIFETHTDLQFLQVRFPVEKSIYDDSSASSSLGSKKYSWSRLQSLKRLEIKYISQLDYKIFLSEFDSPNLRYFQFPCYSDFSSTDHEKLHRIFQETLDTLSRKAPYVEILSFYNCIPLSAIELAISCRQLMELQIIFLSGSSLKKWVKVNYDDVEDHLFTECRSLRWLADDKCCMYAFDHLYKELIVYSKNICLVDQKYSMWSL